LPEKPNTYICQQKPVEENIFGRQFMEQENLRGDKGSTPNDGNEQRNKMIPACFQVVDFYGGKDTNS